MRTGNFARPESPSAAARPPSGAPAGRSSSSLRGAVSSRGLPARIIVVQNRDTARIGHDRPADAPVRPGEQKTAGDCRRRGRREARGARRTAGTARVRLLHAAAVHRVRRPHRVQARAGRRQDDSPGRRPTDGSDAAGAAPPKGQRSDWRLAGTAKGERDRGGGICGAGADACMSRGLRRHQFRRCEPRARDRHSRRRGRRASEVLAS